MDTRSTRLAMLAAASLFACWRGACAQAAPPLDLAGAIRLALAQPGIHAAAQEVAAGAALVGQAGAYPNPALAFLREGQGGDERTTTIQLSQPIELGGKRQARVALAQGELALAQGALVARRRAVRAEVIAAYHAVLVARRKRQLAQGLIGLAQQSVAVAAQRVAAGKVSPIDETRARLAAVDAAAELTRAEADLALAGARLGALLGKPFAAPVLAEQLDDAPPALPPDLPPLATLLARAAEAGAVDRARKQLATRQAQAAVERAARIPDLTLTLGSQRDTQALPVRSSARHAVIGVSLPLPLFNQNRGNLTAALRRADQARDELAAAHLTAVADLASAHTRYGAARSEAALLRRDVLPGAESVYTLTLRGFENGKFAFLDVLDAQRTWFQAQSRHADAVLAAWRAHADIEALAGTDESITESTYP